MKQKKGFIKGALFGALVMLIAAGMIATGCDFYNRNFRSEGIIKKDTETKLEAIRELIDEYYLHEVSEEDLENYLLKGYVSGLKDPYSVYYNQEETKELFETTSGEYSGIGAVMSQNPDTGIITLVNIYKGSPAEEAGLKASDILYKVDGEDISGQDVNKVVTKIKGDEGTEVTLTVIRGEKREEVEVTATRRKLEAQTIEYEMRENHIGYLRVTEFDEVTLNQFDLALEDLKKQGMKGLVIDLRGNPGGSLNTVCKMLDLILPKGTVVYTENKAGKRETATSDEEHKLELPMAVLVNGASASASEIFAGAVQDYGTGTIVGTTTYGKGVVQQLFQMKDGTCVKLTIAEYFTPKGRNINGKGIVPDVEVKYQYDENHPDADNQLDKAVEVVQEKLK